MKSIKQLFKIGNGPSSSHTMGPKKAAEIFLKKNKDATRFIVELYGSLAATGKGHLTDYIILKVLGEDITKIVWKSEVVYDFHTNGMKFTSLDLEGTILDEWLVFSVGGGEIRALEDLKIIEDNVYPHKSMDEILKWCTLNNKDLYEYVAYYEDDDIINYLSIVWDSMKSTIKKGLTKEGVLPGSLKMKRRAKIFYDQYLSGNNFTTLLYGCTLAVSEENAAGGTVVTAPTCGASGVLPGALYSYYLHDKIDEKRIIKALAVAGLIGNLIKENASISGAEVGCQGEVGSACCMTSGAIVYLLGGNCYQSEYAAEIGLEHHLGLTCDPVGGYVQAPCIERNALSAKRAIDAAQYAILTDGTHYISLDEVIITMAQTGKDMNSKYRETSEGGLAINSFTNVKNK